jgi:Protein of unknown function (DUF1648)
MSDGTAGMTGLPGLPGAVAAPHRCVATALVYALQAALLATMVAVPAALWWRLPPRLADHWSFAGTANGSGPRLVTFLVLGTSAVLGTALFVAGWFAGRRGAPVPSGRTARAATAAGLTAIGVFLTAMATGSVLLVSVVNLGGGDLRSDSVGPAAVPLLVGGSALVTAFAALALRYRGLGAPDGDAAPARLGLRAGERAVWSGRARAAWALPAGAVLVAAGALILALATQRVTQWDPGIVLLIAGTMMLGFTSVRVRVATRGVSVSYGALGLRLTRIPLPRLASAAAVELRSFSFGYRGSLLTLGTAAVILRRGPALRLTLRDGKTFTVTVDDAATAAALLNDLIAASQESG